MTATTAPVTPRRAAFAFIFVTVLLDMLAMGMIIPILPKIIEGFLGSTARASVANGWFATIFALLQFVCAPWLGALSDRYGRRPVVLLSNFGLGLDYVLMALAPSLSWLFVGRIIAGISAASVSTAGAYIADVTPPEKRSASFGMLGAAFGIGFVLGPWLGGELGQLAPRLPFWVAAALSLANGLYGLFVLPESLPPERRKAFEWRRANPVGALKLLRSNREVLGLAGVNFLDNLAHVALPSVFVLYAGYRYGWDERMVGRTLGAVGVCTAFVQAVLVRPLVQRLGERRALLLGLLSGMAGFIIYGLAPTGPWFWLGIPVMSLWGLYAAASQGMMSSRISASEQGQLQGALSSLMGIAGMIGPLIFTGTFAYFIESRPDWNLPGAPFLLSAALLVLAMGLAGRATRPSREAGAVPAPTIAPTT